MSESILYLCELCGSQDYIYSVSGADDLKQLRERNEYLEFLLEHIADALLVRLQRPRTNLIYVGGGLAYLLLPNTAQVTSELARFKAELAVWMLHNFKTDLYFADGYVDCDAADLGVASLYEVCSNGAGSSTADLNDADAGKTHYSALMGELFAKLAADKSRRLDAGTFRKINFGAPDPNEDARELEICNKIATDINAEGTREISASRAAALSDICHSVGLKQVGVLRIDVDNLGQVIAGERDPSERDPGNHGATFPISSKRVAKLSQTLSSFFKTQIGEILAMGGYKLQVVYSGGDDLFLIGALNDVMYAAIDIRRAFAKLPDVGELTISAGVGLFKTSYPIVYMLRQTDALLDAAKLHAHKGGKKDSIAIWTKDTVFSWQEFIDEVEPRTHELARIFNLGSENNALNYKIVALLRNYDEPISAPRLAYLLTRNFDKLAHGGAGARDTQRAQIEQIYKWASDPTERGYLITALEWCFYSIREGERNE